MDSINVSVASGIASHYQVHRDFQLFDDPRYPHQPQPRRSTLAVNPSVSTANHLTTPPGQQKASHTSSTVSTSRRSTVNPLIQGILRRQSMIGVHHYNISTPRKQSIKDHQAPDSFMILDNFPLEDAASAGHQVTGFDMDFADFVTGTGLSMKDSLVPANAAMPEYTPLSQTVSPQDLFLDKTITGSDSAVFTNLTTPSMYDGSPDALASYQASPMLAHDLHAGGDSSWYSLFPDTTDHIASPVAQTTESEIPLASMPSPEPVTSTSPGPVPDVLRSRLSSVAGVAKCRRAVKELSPIVVDSGDVKAFKRAKNTMAARKSRQKKRDVEEQLRYELAAMTAERDRWMHIAIQHGAPLPDV